MFFFLKGRKSSSRVVITLKIKHLSKFYISEKNKILRNTCVVYDTCLNLAQVRSKTIVPKKYEVGISKC